MEAEPSPTPSLNYRHLHVFWSVVREGAVTRAAERLNVSQPTITAQVRALERFLGQRLFVRAGRGIALSDFGRAIYRYADEIVGLGQELLDSASGRASAAALRLAVGVANVVPKLIAYRILEPALRLGQPVRLECVEDSGERLLGELAVFGLDIVLSDAPVGAGVRVRAYSHLLGECGVSIFASRRLAEAHRRSFPGCLGSAPLLLPSEDSALRLSLDQWLARQGLRPRVVGAFDDSALMHSFGAAGAGLFPVPSAIEAEVRRQYDVRLVGRLPAVRARFFAITVDRKLKHPAVIAISEAARQRLFQ